jgi:hypothetical protein
VWCLEVQFCCVAGHKGSCHMRQLQVTNDDSCPHHWTIRAVCAQACLAATEWIYHGPDADGSE